MAGKGHLKAIHTDVSSDEKDPISPLTPEECRLLRHLEVDQEQSVSPVEGAAWGEPVEKSRAGQDATDGTPCPIEGREEVGGEDTSQCSRSGAEENHHVAPAQSLLAETAPSDLRDQSHSAREAFQRSSTGFRRSAVNARRDRPGWLKRNRT